jgi:hypothetical protein
VDERTLIDQLVSQWEELRSRGEETSAEELCRDHPELVETLRATLTSPGGAKGRLPETIAFDSDATLEVTPDALATTQERGELTGFGPFQIVKLLAEGEIERVYEAFDRQLGRSVALKVMRPELAGHEQARALFLREARAAAALDNDHSVPIYQVGEHQGVPYLAMQLVVGQPLNERLEQGPPDPAASGGLDLKVRVQVQGEVEESGARPRRARKRFLTALAVLLPMAGLAAGLGLMTWLRDQPRNTRELIQESARDRTAPAAPAATPAEQPKPPLTTTLASVPEPVSVPVPVPVPVPLPQVQDPLDDRIFEVLSADLARRPDDLNARRDRATWLARKRRWDEAAADQLRSFAQPADMLSDPGILLAALRMVSGQAQHYRVMFETLRDLPPSPLVNSRAVYLVRIGILAHQPPAVANRLVELSGALSARLPAPWVIHGNGAALVRAGRLEEGVSRLEQSLEAGPWAGDAMNWLMLALAHERLGHPDVARSWSDRADAWLEQATQAITSGRTVAELGAAGSRSHTSYYLPDWLCALALRSELEALRFDRIFPDDPFVP